MFTACLLIALGGCKGPENRQSGPPVSDSSLIAVQDDTTTTVITDSVAVVSADTVHYEASQLAGKWLREVQGPDKPVMQGFQLKTNGGMVSVNTYSLVYQKWKLQGGDTLLLWSRAEGTDSTGIDTNIIRQLTDTSLVLFPTKAAEGYLERYQRKKM